GFFDIADAWTLDNWRTVLGDELFLRSLHNTLVLATGTAVVAVVAHSLIAYIAVRTRHAARRLLDAIAWLPFTVPGLIRGRALLGAALGRAHPAPPLGHPHPPVRRGGVPGMPAGRPDHQGRPHAAGPWAGGGLAHRRRVVGGPLPAHGAAPEGPAPRGRR